MGVACQGRLVSSLVLGRCVELCSLLSLLARLISCGIPAAFTVLSWACTLEQSADSREMGVPFLEKPCVTQQIRGAQAEGCARAVPGEMR